MGDQTLFEGDSKKEDKKLDEKDSKKAEVKSAEPAAQPPTTPPTVQPKMHPWQNALIKAEGKFLAIADPEKAKIELGFAAIAMANSDKLRACTPDSIMNAVINLARTSLTLNPTLKLCYLVPRDGKCVLDVSYIGMIKILRDNRCIKDLAAYIVYEDEEFENDIVNGVIKHKPIYAKTLAEQKKRNMHGVYTRAILPDGSVSFNFMPMWEVLKIKDSSKAAGSSYSPWNTFEEEMVKKTGIRRHFKTLIAGSPAEQVVAAIEIEDEANGLSDKFKSKNKNQSVADFFTDAELVD